MNTIQLDDLTVSRKKEYFHMVKEPFNKLGLKKDEKVHGKKLGNLYEIIENILLL